MWLDRPSQLYTSKEFRRLRECLMHERVAADGILYCEHCGEPLLKKYDIIAHHVKEVTSENLNDHTITLNPENIKLVHHKCHNEIHERFGCQQRKVYYVYGAPCSGKSTFVRENKGRNDIVVDIDNIWEAVTGKKYFKPNTLKDYVFAMYNELIQQIKMTNRMTGRGFSTAWIIEGGANKADRDRKISMLGAEPIFIEATKEECIERLHNDAERHAIQAEWETYIEKWFNCYIT